MARPSGCCGRSAACRADHAHPPPPRDHRQPHRRRRGGGAPGGGGEGAGGERAGRRRHPHRGDAGGRRHRPDAWWRTTAAAWAPRTSNWRWSATPPPSCRSEAMLFRIATLGFRGEALPSIGAVARLAITSRRAAARRHASTVEGGRKGLVMPAAGAPGTRIEVRDLFYAVPARRKFLEDAARRGRPGGGGGAPPRPGMARGRLPGDPGWAGGAEPRRRGAGCPHRRSARRGFRRRRPAGVRRGRRAGAVRAGGPAGAYPRAPGPSSTSWSTAARCATSCCGPPCASPTAT